MSKEINLLPLPRRRQLARRFFEHRLRRFFTSLLLALGVVSLTGLIALIAILMATSVFYPSAEQGLEKAIVAYRAETRAIQDRNSLISEMQRHHDERIEWTAHLPEFLEVLPAGTQLSRLTGDVDAHRFTLEGKASARSALVVLENKLHLLTWVKSIDAPRANLLEKVLPEFTFTLGL